MCTPEDIIREEEVQTETALAKTARIEVHEETSKCETTFDALMELEHVMGALRNQRNHERGAGADETRGRGRILTLLRVSEGVATRDMAEVLGIRVSSLNESLAKMEHDGLITRTPSDQDRRVMIVSLTDEGMKLAKAPRTDRLDERTFLGFEDAELDQVAGYLGRMTKNLEEGLNERGREDLERVRKAKRGFFDRGADGLDSPGDRHQGRGQKPFGGQKRSGKGRDFTDRGERDRRRQGRDFADKGDHRGPSRGYADKGERRGQGRGYADKGDHRGQGRDFQDKGGARRQSRSANGPSDYRRFEGPRPS